MGRFRFGLMAGFAAGYLLGSKAGRARYDEIMRLVQKAKTTPAYQAAMGKVSAAVGLSLARGRLAAMDGFQRAVRPQPDLHRESNPV